VLATSSTSRSVALILFASSAAAQTVTDGDTIKLDGVTFRIWGIDAAETKQACADGWMAGREATAAMLELVRGRTITCEAKAKDRYGRTVALCEPMASTLAPWGACARLREALGLAGEEQGRWGGTRASRLK
jgi:endonuclease YncB( thermonuclease family)